MNRDWRDFKALHSNIEGAREAFEKSCETLFRKKYSDRHVSQMAVKSGDGGIDIFIGELGVEPITVIQCKFFLETFEDSQKKQIRESFSTAVNSKHFELKDWILCIPRVIDIDENSWWFKWKHKKLKKQLKKSDFIQLINGNELIDLLREANLYNQIFQIIDSQKISELHDALIPKKVIMNGIAKSNLVLFNNYSPKNEPYYLERSIDKEFINSLEINNIWLFGRSGTGKTALINRNLIQNEINYCFCDLSPISISRAEDVFVEILCTIEEKFDLQRNSDENNILKQITKLLHKSGSFQTVIVIDELGVKDHGTLQDIAENFIQLVTHFNNTSHNQDLKFVVSTISNPGTIIRNKSKAGDYFQYLCCDSWEDYSSQLFDILCKALDLNIDSYKALIVEQANNSPRILKAIIKKIVVYRDTSESTIKKAIKLTVSEIV